VNKPTSAILRDTKATLKLEKAHEKQMNSLKAFTSALTVMVREAAPK
jgi:glucosamine 6-phosphate synthetase-like amidotransferase/phosphosugar isomerase protein